MSIYLIEVKVAQFSDWLKTDATPMFGQPSAKHRGNEKEKATTTA